MTNPFLHLLVDMAAFLIAFAVIGFVFRARADRDLQRIKAEVDAGIAEFAGRFSVLRFQLRQQTFIVTSVEGDLFRRLGFSAAQIVNRDIRFFFESVASGAEAYACCESAWSGNEDESYEGMSGGIAFRCSFQPCRIEGTVREVAVAFEDITLRKKAEEQARRASKFESIAAEAADFPVVGLADDGTILYVSPSASGLLEGGGGSLGKTALIDLLHPDDQLLFLRQFGLVKDAGTVVRFRGRIRTADGYLTRNIRLQASKHPAGGISRLAFFEENAEAPPDPRLPTGGKGMGKIAAGVAHEIRNPLTTIKGISQMMGEKYPAEEYLIRVLMEDIGKIEKFLDEFVLLFDQEYGADLAEVDLLVLIREGLEQIRSSSESLESALDAKDMASAAVRGHLPMLQTLVRRILANIAETLEYRGTVRAEAEFRDDYCVIVFVGGADESSLQRLKSDLRTDLPRSRKEFGFGTLVMDKIVEYHNGKLTIEHHPDGAVKVVLALPAYTAEASISRKVQQFKQLTRREKEVLLLLGQGKSNKEMAALLKISENTIKNHLANIFSKLNVYDRAQAIALLYQVPVE